MNRAILTPDGDGSAFATRRLLRERYKAAVGAVIDSARTVAVAHAEHAARVENARQACLAVGFTDQSTGGPTWTPDVVTQRILVTELAVALRLNETDARRLIDTAEGLAGTFTATRTALESGQISYRHAEKIIQHSATLPPECLADYETRLLPIAGRVCVQRLTRHARATAEEAQPQTAIERHLTATTHRHLSLDPAADGMAYLTMFLPAVEATAIYHRATALGKGLKAGGDPRTLAHLRLDTMTDLMLNAETSIPGATHGIRAHITLTVPALTLLGQRSPTPPSNTRRRTSRTGTRPTDYDEAIPASYDEGPAMLDGYGPIDRLTALKLTKDAPSFWRVLTDPATGITLNYGRTRYRPPTDLDHLIRTLHTECTFPTDCAPSTTAEIDHTRPWEHGANTELRNLSPLCSNHHKVKHHTAWHIEQDPARPGTIIWTSPAGYHYTVDPTPITRPTPHFTDATTTRGDQSAGRSDNNQYNLADSPPF
ncbi:HNH endonuclease signature motif containing protein [Subtercola lobariae]|uniref:HNH endonuclease signature motif containing protein n=1 Tax=Subtercola lobariae TaxID=1588641 RepID=UPI001941C137|nr:HNH endonuclease signature motif containing protein [Subtercola lobariae]